MVIYTQNFHIEVGLEITHQTEKQVLYLVGVTTIPCVFSHANLLDSILITKRGEGRLGFDTHCDTRHAPNKINVKL